MFKRARSQYGSAAYNSSMVSSMWAAGKWMAANQTIKQEKASTGGGTGGGGGGGGGGGMMTDENTGGSPVNSPSYPGSFPESTNSAHSAHTAVPFTNYEGASNMSSMASNVYAASLNSNTGTEDWCWLSALDKWNIFLLKFPTTEIHIETVMMLQVPCLVAVVELLSTTRATHTLPIPAPTEWVTATGHLWRGGFSPSDYLETQRSITGSNIKVIGSYQIRAYYHLQSSSRL